MEHVKKVGIIGAGISGIITAKTCLEYGYEVKVFEKDSELGGVWASSRRYPGVTTQNTKDTYFFSDFPMPKHFAEWPIGEDVQSYLLAFAKKFNVFPLINFSHIVTNASFENNQWTVAGKRGAIPFTEQFDFLVVCNGTFSDPFIPELPGMDKFTAAGGTILHSTQFNSTAISKDKRVVVVGYSKSACDVVAAVSDTAKSAHLVFREAKWKLPQYVNGVNAKYMFLNRLGEAIINTERLTKTERFVHKLGLPTKMLSFMQRHLTKKQLLAETGLVPYIKIQDQVFGEISVETPQFFKKVKDGKIIAKQDEIVSFKPGQVILNSGEQISCDVVVFGTGFRQTIPFLSDHLLEKFTDKQGNYLLYHHILPAGVPALAFVGYNTSLYTTLTSEMAALWVCEYLKGRIAKPTDAAILKEGAAFIKWRSQFRTNSALRGLSVMPGSIHHVDMLLKDMNASLPFFSLLPDWLVTINPARYQQVRKKLLQRNSQ